MKRVLCAQKCFGNINTTDQGDDIRALAFFVSPDRWTDISHFHLASGLLNLRFFKNALNTMAQTMEPGHKPTPLANHKMGKYLFYP